MKFKTVRIISVLFASLILVNCGGNKNAKPVSASDVSLKTPTKEILVTEGDLNKKYTILGPIDYTPKEGSSVYADQFEANKQAKELLKKAAFTKYGEKVDAIINTHIDASMKGGFWGAVGAGYGAKTMARSIEGVAVSFDEGNSKVVEEPKASTEAEEVKKPKKALSKGKKKSKKSK